MRSLICSGGIALCWSLLSSVALFAQTQPPETIVATGRIAGRIVSADRATSIAGAVVQLIGQRGGVRTETSDDSGRYEFTDLRADSYSVICAKTGFVVVPNAGSSPSTSGWIASPQTTIELAVGQVRRDVDIRLSRWGVIAVHVADDLGNPREGVEVRALAIAGVGVERKMSRTDVAVRSSPNFWQRKEFLTDDRGDVRIYGLSAGNYVVVAEPLWDGPIMDVSAAGHERILSTTYYPGTSSATEAQALSLHPGDEVSVRLSLVQARTVSISGQVARWDGSPGRAFVVLRWNPAGVVSPDNMLSDTVAWADLVDGRFSFENVHPGEYVIETSYDKDTPDRDGEASVAVSVSTSDVSGLVLTTVQPQREQ